VFVLALLTTLGGASLAHSMYRLRHPEWRTLAWWGNHRVARVALVSTSTRGDASSSIRTVQRAADVVRALETLALGTIVLMIVVVAAASSIA
jgi:hypothetical protein